MYYDPIYQNEQIYIAGPECFYTNGYPHWVCAGREGRDVRLRRDYAEQQRPASWQLR